MSIWWQDGLHVDSHLSVILYKRGGGGGRVCFLGLCKECCSLYLLPVAEKDSFPKAQLRNTYWWIWSGSCLFSKEVPWVLSRRRALWMLYFFFLWPTSLKKANESFQDVASASLERCFKLWDSCPVGQGFLIPLCFCRLVEQGILDCRWFPYRRVLVFRWFSFVLCGVWGPVWMLLLGYTFLPSTLDCICTEIFPGN